MLASTNKHTHIAGKEKTCKATADLDVSLIGNEIVIDSDGILFPLSLYFIFFPVRTSAGWDPLSVGMTHTFLKGLSPQLSCIFFFYSFPLTFTVVLGSAQHFWGERHPKESPIFQNSSPCTHLKQHPNFSLVISPFLVKIVIFFFFFCLLVRLHRPKMAQSHLPIQWNHWKVTSSSSNSVEPLLCLLIGVSPHWELRLSN